MIELTAPFVPSDLTYLPRLVRTGMTPRRVVDLGCGDGQVLAWFQQHYPACRLTGYELNAELVAAAQARLGEQAVILESDLWLADVSQADLVYCYLTHEAMARVLTDIAPRMKPGALLLSHHFQLPGDLLYLNLGNLFAYPVLLGVGRDDLAGEL